MKEKIKLNDDIINKIEHHNLKAIDMIQFLLQNDNITIKVSSLDFNKTKQENINNLAIKDLRYNFKNIKSAYIDNLQYIVLILE